MKKHLMKLVILLIYLTALLSLPQLIRLSEITYISANQEHTTESFNFLQKDLVRMLAVRDKEGVGIGTGFYISKSVIVTAAHVVSRVGVNGNVDVIETIGYTGIRGKVMAIDTIEDIALIIVSPDFIVDKETLLKIIDVTVPSAGETLYSSGYAHGDIFYVSRGDSLGMQPDPLNDNHRLLGTRASLVSGMSGGPAFNKDGRIVGVNTIGMASITATKVTPGYYGGLAPASGIYDIACNQAKICR